MEVCYDLLMNFFIWSIMSRDIAATWSMSDCEVDSWFCRWQLCWHSNKVEETESSVAGMGKPLGDIHSAIGQYFNEPVSDTANSIILYFNWKLTRLVAPDNTLFRYILQELAFCVNNLSMLADSWSPKNLLHTCKSMLMDNNCAGQ
jgi:hypothetical protein